MLNFLWISFWFVVFEILSSLRVIEKNLKRRSEILILMD